MCVLASYLSYLSSCATYSFWSEHSPPILSEEDSFHLELQGVALWPAGHRVVRGQHPAGQKLGLWADTVMLVGAG